MPFAARPDLSPHAPQTDAMFFKRKPQPEHAPFAALPVRTVTLDHGGAFMAVHLAGTLARGRVPVVCVPGYQRNMTDFTEFAARFARAAGGGWPLLLVDLQGRGRSSRRPDKAHYGTPRDARDLALVLMALGIEKAVFVGQGYGGQVAMMLGVAHPLLMAGAVLVDSGPVTDSRGIVRLRSNVAHIESLRGARHVTAGYRRMLSGTYPGAGEALLERLSQRTHRFDRRGRARPLYDPHLIERLKTFSLEDVMSPQWAVFEALRAVPLMILRTQLTDQLRRETFDEMMRRRPDAEAFTIAGQGSPALLDDTEVADAIARFVRRAGGARKAA